MKIENYIENVYRELMVYKNIEYENLYTNFSNHKLVEIFSTIHHLIVRNLKKMNSRLPTKDGIAHFWADNSRELILAIGSVKGLQRALAGSEYLFEIEPYYKKIINKSYDFLSESGGSVIPAQMEKIELYYTIPLFISKNTLKIDSLNDTFNVELKQIGEGSYAHVYKFKDTFYNKYCVVKRAKMDLEPKELERFKREFEYMTDLSSPYIVEVYAYNKNKNEYYMEYMDDTLYDYINKNNTKLNYLKRKNILRQILKAFQYIQSKDILHRDISPNNILVKNYEDINIIKVADFGLIKIPDSQLTSLWTEFKGWFNDPSLQTDGFHTYNILHETYALTRIIGFVMTGKTNLSNVRDSDLQQFINKGLSGNKDNRFQSVNELVDAFNEI